MLWWLPSLPYPPAREDGYWAPITSTLDWCEENYYATRYSAEIVNTFTNVLFIYLGSKGLYNCWTQGHDRIFFISFIGYLVVGTGSFAFHSTLKYPMQLLDELSMIYTTCLMTWASFAHNRARWLQWTIGLLVTALAIFITAYYHYLQDPTFHQNAYAILTAVVLIRSMVVMELNMRPLFRRQRQERERTHSSDKTSGLVRAEQQRQNERDLKILRHMWAMIATGLSVFLGGFAIWGLDNVHCTRLRRWRREIGLPWGILLEGHGWWHIMTCIGAYFYIVWGIWLRHCVNGRQDEYEMVWPRFLTSVPEIVRRSHPPDGSVMNGSAKKME